MSRFKVALIPGDGIGPELTEATLKVLKAVDTCYGLDLNIVQVEAGDSCFERRGVALPEDTLREIKNSHVCLKGPVGETAAQVIVKLRILFDLYANIRPIKSYPGVSCLRPDIDFVIVRENTEGVYRGIEFMVKDSAFCVRVITREGCERIARKAFELAKRRNKKRKVTAVHKANVMKLTCGLFRDTCREIAKNYPEISFEEQYVDAMAMRLIKEPQRFDVVVTTNMFGDILSDEAAQLVGGLGMAPSANIGDEFALFEPIHGSAPSRAGKQTANPTSMILSSKMMLEWLGEKYGEPKCIKAAETVEKALISVIEKKLTVPDLGGCLKTFEMGEAIAEEVKALCGK
ncbi:3-isopropylmalate dehydrogenase [Candidatus Bathyarchaeota archaeon]|nr:MAG: 3-isopropylmalate dehydrogenase [Candidatus Bathyarchaeota archaeon]